MLVSNDFFLFHASIDGKAVGSLEETAESLLLS